MITLRRRTRKEWVVGFIVFTFACMQNVEGRRSKHSSLHAQRPAHDAVHPLYRLPHGRFRNQLQERATIAFALNSRGGGFGVSDVNDGDDHHTAAATAATQTTPIFPHVQFASPESLSAMEEPSFMSPDQTLGSILEDPQPQPALIIMDAFSPYHASYMSFRAREAYGFAIIDVVSRYMRDYFALHGDDDEQQELLPMCMPSDIIECEAWMRQLPPHLKIVGVYCESDSGLADAEQLAGLLRVPCHNGAVDEVRRNKYLMNERIGSAGLPRVQQRLCENMDDVNAFLNELAQSTTSTTTSTFPKVIVKPVRGVGSDDVFLCDDLESVSEAFKTIQGSTVFGSPRDKHRAVLLQEYAVGQEYSLDVVSCDGRHEIAAIWKYDKRSVNGSPFVYFATRLYDGPDADVVAQYTKEVLSALDVRWGISHNEVIVTEDGPRLVEVNCRQHNMDFLPLVMSCIGRNIFDVMLSGYRDAYDSKIANDGGDAGTRDDKRGESTQQQEATSIVPSLRMHGAMMHLVNYEGGILQSINEEALMEIQNMESTLDLEVFAPFLAIGNSISPTKDICTDAGWVQLVNDDETAFQRDYDRIIELMPTLFGVAKSGDDGAE